MPPTPEEVYEQFIVQPIPGLGFDVQPPDLGLVNLPKIFYTWQATYTMDGGPSTPCQEPSPQPALVKDDSFRADRLSSLTGYDLISDALAAAYESMST